MSQRSLRCRVWSTTPPPQPSPIVSLTLPSGNAHAAIGGERDFSAATVYINNNSNNNNLRHRVIVVYVNTHVYARKSHRGVRRFTPTAREPVTTPQGE